MMFHLFRAQDPTPQKKFPAWQNALTFYCRLLKSFNLRWILPMTPTYPGGRVPAFLHGQANYAPLPPGEHLPPRHPLRGGHHCWR
jgi:hypothetical protein